MRPLALLALLAACSVPPEDRTAGNARPNIVLILTDDLGVHDLGCYGRAEHRTPNLDRLAAEGLRFTSAYCAQPICSPSRAAILTGKTPARLHLTTYLPGRPDARSQKLLHPKIRRELPLEERTLAEVLREAGWATAAFGKWHLGGRGFGPEAQGFDVVFAGRGNTTPSAEEGGKGEYELTSRAEAFIRENRSRPFFLYLAHHTPHIPLAARPERVAAFRKAFHPVYAAMMETMDDAVGRLLRAVEDLGLRERTIVLFTSDNGGLHVPEGREDAPTHNSPYRAGKGFLYEGGLRVPFLVRWPGRIPAGRTVDDPFVNTDVLPTLLELAGVQAPGGLDGVSLAGLWTGRGRPAPRILAWHFPHYTNQGSRPAGAIREGNWKLVEHYENGRVELFDLARDPGETEDVSTRESARAEDLRRKLAEWRRSVGAQENAPNPDFDPALHRVLYEETDVSRLRPGATAAGMTPRLAAWRRALDGAVRRPDAAR